MESWYKIEIILYIIEERIVIYLMVLGKLSFNIENKFDCSFIVYYK